MIKDNRPISAKTKSKLLKLVEKVLVFINKNSYALLKKVRKANGAYRAMNANPTIRMGTYLRKRGRII